ncbi:MAG: glycosyl hydrolase family 95 catalytic domain-containing protein [Opitutales bacterium]
MRRLPLVALPLAVALLGAAEPLPELRFNAPAKSFHEACLVGNGRLGAMDFGDLAKNRIVLNEQTLWSGSDASPLRESAVSDWKQVTALLLAGKIGEAEKLAENTLTANPWGMTRGRGPKMTFGCYQTLGDLWIIRGDATTSSITSPSGHEGEANEGPGNLIDGDPTTKWCAVHHGKAPVLELDLGGRRELTGYSLTSGNDMPGRDPRNWTVEATEDGATWRTVDRRENQPAFARRGERKTFTLAQPVAARRLRLTLQPNSGGEPMSADYLQLAEIGVLPERTLAPTGYDRRLELASGASVTRASGHRRIVQALREPANVLVVIEESDQPYDLTLRLSRKQDVAYRANVDDMELIMEGQLPSNDAAKEGMRYHARLRVRAEAASRQVTPEGIVLKGVKGRMVAVLAARTNFGNNSGAYSPAEMAAFDIERALPATDEAAGQLADEILKGKTREPMGRFALQIEGTPPEVLALSTPERVARMKRGEDDPDLIATYAQYGRHLLVGSSAPDSPLPANLQGLWAEEYTPPWNADYHTNINLQMNYWPAHPTNLADHAAPYHRYIQAFAKSGEDYAKRYFGARGWQGGISSNAWAVAAPGDPGSAGWTLLPAVNGWLACDLVRHLTYTAESDFYKKAYPIIRGAARFYQDTLVELPGRGLVTSPSSSPENAYRLPSGAVHKMCLGATMDQQIVDETLNAACWLSTVLNVDAEERKGWQATQQRLAKMKVGPDGRLQEWLEPYDEPEPHHRHVSHLWGLYPGKLISVRQTPELAAAARATLEKRTDASTGWSMAWKACFWARLRDGDRAAKLLRLLIGRGDPNLLCQHPPFQIDGNFGGTAAICELLVQRDGGVIELVPALPASWKKGRVRGLVADGGCELAFAWERQADGTVAIRDLVVKSKFFRVDLRVGDKVRRFQVEPDKPTPLQF